MKNVLVMFVLVLSFSFVAAHGFEGSREVKFNGGIDYEFNNNGREPVGNFNAWGVREKKFSGSLDYELNNGDRLRGEKFDFHGERRFGGKVPGKNFYYKYVSHMRTWKKVTCYNTPPKDRIFYIKC